MFRLSVDDRGGFLKIVIGNKNYSSWSLRAWLALAQTGAEFEEILIPLDTPEMKSNIERFSPAGRVPVLIDDGLAVWDSLAIIEYLADKFPSAGLWSADTGARAMQRSVSAEMHSGFAALRSTLPMNIRRQKSDRVLAPDVQADIDRICDLWRQALERKTADGPFLFGGFCGVDCMFAPVVSRFETYNVPVGDTERAYMDAVLSHGPFLAWAQAAMAESWIVAADEV